MGIPRHNEEKRTYFLPIIARYFSDHGYDGATTAGIAKACEVRENVLYRIWPDKEAMFIAVIDYILHYTIQFWDDIPRLQNETRIEAILRRQSKDHGVMRFYRIVYSGLLQDSTHIRSAIRRLYSAVHLYLQQAIEEHRTENQKAECQFDADAAAWGMMGLAAMVDIQRELRIKSQDGREILLRDTSHYGFLE
jgi:AcrR family transcriptional regulator